MPVRALLQSSTAPRRGPPGTWRHRSCPYVPVAAGLSPARFRLPLSAIAREYGSVRTATPARLPRPRARSRPVRRARTRPSGHDPEEPPTPPKQPNAQRNQTPPRRGPLPLATAPGAPSSAPPRCHAVPPKAARTRSSSGTTGEPRGPRGAQPQGVRKHPPKCGIVLVHGRRGARSSSRKSTGTWRSLVAHLTGGQGVVGSNPAVPTV